MARTLVGMFALAGNEHDGPMRATGGGQHVLNFQTIKIRHRNIEYGASWNRLVMLFQEYLRRRIGLDVIPLGAEQSRQGLENSGVIVNEVNREHVCHIQLTAGC
jgi:hypothetical protein